MQGTIATPESIKLLQNKYGIIGESQLIKEALEKLLLAAPTDITVLITGETGTGKEIFANAVHGLSKRKRQPYISVNCGAIPETLLESELFGHEKGAFTGATDQRKGFFEVADKGTIFLDEIGEMPFGTQVKLLRVLESGEFTRLGSTAPKKVDVRVIAATNRDLGYEVANGNFRQDLYFRLNSVHLFLPPLRQHPEDIKSLVDFFAGKACERLGLKFDGIAKDALDILRRLPWPGNIRELRNLIETLVTLEQETYITSDILQRYIPKALPARSDSPIPSSSAVVQVNRNDSNQVLGMELIFRTILELKKEINEVKQMIHTLANQMEAIKVDILTEQAHHSDSRIYYSDDENLNIFDREKEMIVKALAKSDGNRRLAASELGISERTLYRKIIEYGIS